MDTHRKSNLYAVVQFVLIAIFAIVFFFDPGPAMMVSLAIVGDILCAGALVLVAAAFVSLREVIQVVPEPKAGGHLVTSGVYSRLRHPIYTGIALLAAGLFLREPGVYVAFAGAVVIAFLVVKSRFEERLLRERYADYDAYRKRSWGVLPGL